MKEPIISPDGKHMLVDGEWILLPGQEVNISDSAIAGNVSIKSTVNVNVKNDNEKEIRNLAELIIDRLKNGDMKSASEFVTDAKKIDHELATSLLESEYHLRIGEAYADIVESYLVKIISTKVTHESNNFGYGVVSHDVQGNHESSILLDMLEIAFNNALHFLGEPDSLAPGGIQLNYSEFLDEYGTIDYDSEALKELKQIDFTSKPDEIAIKQKYRIGLALSAAALKIANDFMEIHSKLPYGDVNRRFLDYKRPVALSVDAIFYTLKVIAIAAHEEFDLAEWKNEFDAKLTLLKIEQTRNKLLNERLIRETEALRAQNQRAQASDCFIATAAYGTKYEEKINVLRCWRDTKLMPSKVLSPFVRFYYKYSPPIAKFISNKPFFRRLVRVVLTPTIFLIGLVVRSEYPLWTDQGNPQ